jgi:hypothetical protein
LLALGIASNAEDCRFLPLFGGDIECCRLNTTQASTPSDRMKKEHLWAPRDKSLAAPGKALRYSRLLTSSDSPSLEFFLSALYSSRSAFVSGEPPAFVTAANRLSKVVVSMAT